MRICRVCWDGMGWDGGSWLCLSSCLLSCSCPASCTFDLNLPRTLSIHLPSDFLTRTSLFHPSLPLFSSSLLFFSLHPSSFSPFIPSSVSLFLTYSLLLHSLTSFFVPLPPFLNPSFLPAQPIHPPFSLSLSLSPSSALTQPYPLTPIHPILRTALPTPLPPLFPLPPQPPTSNIPYPRRFRFRSRYRSKFSHKDTATATITKIEKSKIHTYRHGNTD